MSVEATFNWLQSQDDESAQEVARVLEVIVDQMSDTEALQFAAGIRRSDEAYAGMQDQLTGELVRVLIATTPGGLKAFPFYLDRPAEELIEELLTLVTAESSEVTTRSDRVRVGDNLELRLVKDSTDHIALKTSDAPGQAVNIHLDELRGLITALLRLAVKNQAEDED